MGILFAYKGDSCFVHPHSVCLSRDLCVSFHLNGAGANYQGVENLITEWCSSPCAGWEMVGLEGTQKQGFPPCFLLFHVYIKVMRDSEMGSLSLLVLVGESCGNTVVTSEAVVLTMWSSDPWVHRTFQSL